MLSTCSTRRPRAYNSQHKRSDHHIFHLVRKRADCETSQTPWRRPVRLHSLASQCAKSSNFMAKALRPPAEFLKSQGGRRLGKPNGPFLQLMAAQELNWRARSGVTRAETLGPPPKFASNQGQSCSKKPKPVDRHNSPEPTALP